MFQSTRPRGARHHNASGDRMQVIVSIHAPAWGATCRLPMATTSTDCFNPRARVGRDDHHETKQTRIENVSIHAPAWGATRSATITEEVA